MFRMFGLMVSLLRLLRAFSLLGAVVLALTHAEEVYDWSRDLLRDDPESLARQAKLATQNAGDYVEQASQRPLADTVEDLAGGTGADDLIGWLKRLFGQGEIRTEEKILRVPSRDFLHRPGGGT